MRGVSTLATLSDIESTREQLINRRQRLDPGQLEDLVSVPDALVPSLGRPGP